MISSEEALKEVREILWPKEDPDQQWEPQDLERVSEAVMDPDIEDLVGESEASKTLREIREILYPGGPTEHEWSGDTIEEVAWAMESYLADGDGTDFAGLEAVSPQDVDLLNHHRRCLGMPPLSAAAGYTADELRRMAESIRKTGVMANPSRLRAVYDGKRRGKHMLVLLPSSEWGGKAYGLDREDDFRFHGQPAAGAELEVTVSDPTYNRLARQRDRRTIARTEAPKRKQASMFSPREEGFALTTQRGSSERVQVPQATQPALFEMGRPDPEHMMRLRERELEERAARKRKRKKNPATKEYILTYWWFGPAGQLPAALWSGSSLPNVAGGRTGVAQIVAPDPTTAVRQFRNDVGDISETGDFAVLSVIEFPSLTIADRSIFVDGPLIDRSMVDDIDPSSAGAEDLSLDAGVPSQTDAWIVTGTIAGDDLRFVQMVTGAAPDEAVRKVLVWLKQDHGVDAETAEIWSVAHRGDGGTPRVYKGTATPGRSSISTTGRSWLRGQFEELSFSAGGRVPKPAPPRPPQVDLDVINQHRRRIGQPPIDLADGWSGKEIGEMAESIRRRGTTHNPALARLKAKLMR